MNFGARLDALAEMVPPCDTLIDVGTDHAYLPVMLIGQDKVRRAIAGDIGEGPCEAARKTVSLYHLSDRVDVRLGSGLTVVTPGEVNVIVMAGMGAGTMLQVLAASPDVWQHPACCAMVLQPMSDSEKIRRWCEASGWGIEAENLAKEGPRIYEMLRLIPCAGYRYPGLSYLVGDDLVKKKHPLLGEFVSSLKEKYGRTLASMRHSRQAVESAHYQEYSKIYDELEELSDGNHNQ
jgi:tRNA (adenine22-N1)-methyltransferase